EVFAEVDDRRDCPSCRSTGDGRVLEILRADAEDHTLPVERSELRPVVHAQTVLTERRDQRAVLLLHVRADEVHRRRADELGDEEVDGTLVELLRRTRLL